MSSCPEALIFESYGQKTGPKKRPFSGPKIWPQKNEGQQSAFTFLGPDLGPRNGPLFWVRPWFGGCELHSASCCCHFSSLAGVPCHWHHFFTDLCVANAHVGFLFSLAPQMQSLSLSFVGRKCAHFGIIQGCPFLFLACPFMDWGCWPFIFCYLNHFLKRIRMLVLRVSPCVVLSWSRLDLSSLTCPFCYLLCSRVGG